VARVLLALGASLAYALYVVLAKATLARTPPLPLAAANFTVAALVLTPALAGAVLLFAALGLLVTRDAA
jgi:drug/metabolite transporter (DMT)-like permease